VEARRGVSTGISAADRAHTVQVVSDPAATPDDIVRPGHVVPLCACRDGVQCCPRPPEAAIQLTVLAGLAPAASLCHILRHDGSSANSADSARFAARRGLRVIRVSEVAQHRFGPDNHLALRAVDRLETSYGSFAAYRYVDRLTDVGHLALVYGDIGPAGGKPVVSLHAECSTGTLLGATACDCDCDETFRAALRGVADAGRGVVVRVGRPVAELDLRCPGKLDATATGLDASLAVELLAALRTDAADAPRKVIAR
jgi:3,4-dihydroxy 2-butanone 4-phosphate synthase/GTP cyclohydrolase II